MKHPNGAQVLDPIQRAFWSQVDSVLRSTLPGMTLDESYEAKEKPGRKKRKKDMRQQ